MQQPEPLPQREQQEESQKTGEGTHMRNFLSARRGPGKAKISSRGIISLPGSLRTRGRGIKKRGNAGGGLVHNAKKCYNCEYGKVSLPYEIRTGGTGKTGSAQKERTENK